MEIREKRNMLKLFCAATYWATSSARSLVSVTLLSAFCSSSLSKVILFERSCKSDSALLRVSFASNISLVTPVSDFGEPPLQNSDLDDLPPCGDRGGDRARGVLFAVLLRESGPADFGRGRFIAKE